MSFTACDDGTTPILGNTPAAVLGSIEEAFNSRDIDGLARCLAEDFTFHFDPDDVGTIIGDYTIPATWGREDFLGACGSMFDNAYSIDFDVEYETVAEPDGGITEFTVEDVWVYLLVLVAPQNGFVAQGPCDFRFLNEGANGTEVWIITDWWDKTSPLGTFASPTPKSVGIILANFYQ
jgi:hypothetical protein